jgi:hypothetical protein
VRSFILLVHDDRYSVPTLVFTNVADENRAREIADRELDKSDHYLAVDVEEGDHRWFRIQRDGIAAQAGPSPHEA